MAPVYDFRHVELDKIGRGKRIVKPPGGECSDIFGDSPAHPSLSTPRKTNNYMQSSIFTPDSPDAPQNGHSQPTTPTSGKVLDTQGRLFGASSPSGDEDTPRKIVNRQRSSIFEDEVDSRPSSAKSTPVRRNQINPITGSPIYENGTPNGTPNGTTNGTNGHTNGTTNGHSTPESPTNGNVRVRNPPGGRSSGIF